jgi:hypothetical protein
MVFPRCFGPKIGWKWVFWKEKKKGLVFSATTIAGF